MSQVVRLAQLGLVLTAAIGCGGSGSGLDVNPGGPNRTVDGGGDSGANGTVGSGAEACMCHLDSQNVLEISWDCYCRQADCTAPFVPSRAACYGSFVSYPDCGLVVQTAFAPVGGELIWVYDESGHLVGRQQTSDDANFPCPSEPSLYGYARREGQFPDPSCVPGPCVGVCAICSSDGGSNP